MLLLSVVDGTDVWPEVRTWCVTCRIDRLWTAQYLGRAIAWSWFGSFGDSTARGRGVNLDVRISNAFVGYERVVNVRW